MIHTGSLVTDAGRKIAKIDYDYNNNPVRIQFTNGNVTKYFYSATGEKLRVIYQTSVYKEDAEIVESGRDNIRIHGGRQEKKNPDGSWSKNYTGLKKTYGCLRASDEDMKTFKAFTDYLESTDDLEKAGKVIVKDDIEQYNKNIKDDIEQYNKNRNQ